MPAARPLAERFWEKVDKNGPVHPVLATRCWLWTACRDRKGYGHIGVRSPRFTERAARVSYQLNVGPIPAEMEVCHHCDNPPCVNPEHLFIGTTQDNTADMVRKGRARNPTAEAHRAKTHCPQGHEYTPENTYDYSDGRKCRTCIRAKRVAFRARRKLHHDPRVTVADPHALASVSMTSAQSNR